jgi:hypothetical protein
MAILNTVEILDQQIAAPGRVAEKRADVREGGRLDDAAFRRAANARSA